MFNTQPPTYKTYFIDLPLARLHVMETGRGVPLIMVPATISELENWISLAQFMGQWFRVFFFELPVSEPAPRTSNPSTKKGSSKPDDRPPLLPRPVSPGV